MKTVISFPAGKTWEYIEEYHVHTHAVKKGYPTLKKIPQYIAFRKKGGVIEHIFEVVKMIEINPLDLEAAKEHLSDDEYGRLCAYDKARANMGYKHAPQYKYRFYFLEPSEIEGIQLPIELGCNPQSHTYHYLNQFIKRNLADDANK